MINSFASIKKIAPYNANNFSSTKLLITSAGRPEIKPLALPEIQGGVSPHAGSQRDLHRGKSHWTQHATVHLTEMKRLHGLQCLTLRGVALDSHEHALDHSQLAKSQLQPSPTRSGHVVSTANPFGRSTELTDPNKTLHREPTMVRIGNQKIPFDPEKRIEILRKQDLLKRQKSTLPNLLYFNPK